MIEGWAQPNGSAKYHYFQKTWKAVPQFPDIPDGPMTVGEDIGLQALCYTTAQYDGSPFLVSMPLFSMRCKSCTRRRLEQQGKKK